ncbi:MAG: MarR family winged helix-turn-helix transcriptional regulator, partial [Paracoccaceae bacterium]
ISIRYHMGMNTTFGTPEHIAELLVHVGRAACSEDGPSDLTAAQWACLRFLARANARTRTPSGFAAYQATTRGTASQIIKALEGRGMIARHRAEDDGRSVRLELTEVGRTLVSRDPLDALIGVIATLPEVDQARFQRLLSRIASAVANLRQSVAFGICLDCCHFTPADAGGTCACMAAQLGANETIQLCGSYRSSPPTHGDHNDPA